VNPPVTSPTHRPPGNAAAMNHDRGRWCSAAPVPARPRPGETVRTCGTESELPPVEGALVCANKIASSAKPIGPALTGAGFFGVCAARLDNRGRCVPQVLAMSTARRRNHLDGSTSSSFEVNLLSWGARPRRDRRGQRRVFGGGDTPKVIRPPRGWSPPAAPSKGRSPHSDACVLPESAARFRRCRSSYEWTASAERQELHPTPAPWSRSSARAGGSSP